MRRSCGSSPTSSTNWRHASAHSVNRAGARRKLRASRWQPPFPIGRCVILAGQVQPSSPSETPINPTQYDKKLGEVSIDSEAFGLDLKINEGYQNYSAELLRLALLILTGLSAVWLKVYLPSSQTPPPNLSKASFVLSFAVTTLSALAALLHRYTAADSLAFHLTALRRRSRNRPAKVGVPSDCELANKQEMGRDRRFQWANRLLLLSITLLFLGLVLFGAAAASIMFH